MKTYWLMSLLPCNMTINLSQQITCIRMVQSSCMTLRSKVLPCIKHLRPSLHGCRIIHPYNKTTIARCLSSTFKIAAPRWGHTSYAQKLKGQPYSTATNTNGDKDANGLLGTLRTRGLVADCTDEALGDIIEKDVQSEHRAAACGTLTIIIVVKHGIPKAFML